MKKMEEKKMSMIKALKEKCEEKNLPVSEHKGDLFLNADDKQAISYEDGKFKFLTITGSRYFYAEEYTEEEIDKLVTQLEKIASKSTEQINEEYQQIAKGIGIDIDEAYNEKDIIKSIRKKTGLTQKAFGKKYGIPERTIQDWETGKRKPTAYVMEMLNKTIEDEKLAPMTYVFEHYRDKAGYGEVKYFATKEEAVNYAKKDWNHLNDADQKSYKIDPAGRFDVTLRKMRWDDDEWICEHDSEQDIWDALED